MRAVRPRPTTSFLLSSLCLATCLVACGDEEPKDPEFLAPPSSSLVLTNELRGLAAFNTNSYKTAGQIVARDLESVSHVVVHSQLYSELTHLGSPDASAPRLENELRELYNAGVGADLGQVANTWLVVELDRLDGTWLADWTDGVRDNPDVRQQDFTFQARADVRAEDYQNAIIARTLAALSDAPVTPDAVILGSRLDAHYLRAPADWAALTRFVRRWETEVRSAHPDVRLSVGLNWSSFMDDIVPGFAASAGRDRVDYLAMAAAWDTVIQPLYFDETGRRVLDFYAFASIPDAARYGNSPASLPDTHYAGIPTMFRENGDRRLPVAWFAIGLPVENNAPTRSREFLDRFLALNNGYDIQLVSWWGFNHLLPSECDRIIARRQPGEAFSNRTIEASRPACLRGMYDDNPLISQNNPIVARFFGR